MILGSLQMTLILFCVLLFLPESATAQLFEKSAQSRQLPIENSENKLPLQDYMLKVEDPHLSLTFKNVLQRYQDGKAQPMESGKGAITFGLENQPTWFILPVQNNTQNTKFIMALYDNYFETQGALEEVLLFTVRSGERISPRSIHQSYFELEIPPDEPLLLLLYIEPTKSWPVVFSPQLIAYDQFVEKVSLHSQIPLHLSHWLLGLGLAGFLIFGLQNARFLFHILAYFLFSSYIILSSSLPVELPLPDLIHAYLFISLLLSVAITTVLQNRISLKDHNELISIGVPIILMIICLIFVHFIPQGFGLINALLLSIPGMLLCISMAAILVGLYQSGRFNALWFLLVWGSLFLAVIFMLINGIPGLLNVLPVWMPLICMSVAMIFLLVSMLAAQYLSQSQFGLDYSQIGGAVRALRDVDEKSEYDKLLLVMEREKKKMAELREIDVRRRQDMQSAKEAADEANRAKSSFLAVISHEIRTPMTGILGIVRMLLDSPLNNEQHKYVKTIMDSGESMITLLNDILDFEKIESGKLSLEHVRYDFDQMIQSAATLMAGHARHKNINLEVFIAPEVPPQVKGDPARLRQVLLNLAGNAIKFTEQGSVRIDIRLADQKNHDQNTPANSRIPLEITIQDTGIGIAPDALRNLFDPFQQADQGIARKYGGSGLGLAICKKLIEAMGGQITVESKVGEGSSFKVLVELQSLKNAKAHFQRSETPTFYAKAEETGQEQFTQSDSEPYAPQVSKQATSSSADDDTPYEEKKKGLSILIVEDNELSREIIKGFLEKQGHRVSEMSNAEDALEYCRTKAPDFLLIDWELPGLSGPQAIEKLRTQHQDYKAHSIPAVLLTGHRLNLAEAGLPEGLVQEIINKPVSPEDLAEIIQKLFPSSSDNRGEHISKNEESEMIESLPITEEKTSLSDQSETDAPDIFDRETIDTLLETLGEKKVMELLENVFEKNDEIIHRLNKAVSDHNCYEIQSGAHELKGMSGNFALKELEALAKQMEQEAKNDSIADHEALLMKISKASANARLAVNQLSSA